jgi:hypothetical protein
LAASYFARISSLLLANSCHPAIPYRGEVIKGS